MKDRGRTGDPYQDSALLMRRLKQTPLHSESLNIRLYRSISWLKAAKKQEQDIDMAYLCLWVSFNACYAVDEDGDTTLGEKEKFRQFIARLVRHDEEKRIFNILWEKFSNAVRVMLENRYVFKPFWDYQRSQTGSWKKKLENSVREANLHLADRNVAGLLEILLDRLYVLRNQLIHGGATYQSSINRKTIRDGCRILQFLVPVIIEIMMANPQEDWGEIHFPVVKD
jgi:hypothetical protein